MSTTSPKTAARIVARCLSLMRISRPSAASIATRLSFAESGLMFFAVSAGLHLNHSPMSGEPWPPVRGDYHTRPLFTLRLPR